MDVVFGKPLIGIEIGGAVLAILLFLWIRRAFPLGEDASISHNEEDDDGITLDGGDFAHFDEDELMPVPPEQVTEMRKVFRQYLVTLGDFLSAYSALHDAGYNVENLLEQLSAELKSPLYIAGEGGISLEGKVKTDPSEKFAQHLQVVMSKIPFDLSIPLPVADGPAEDQPILQKFAQVVHDVVSEDQLVEIDDPHEDILLFPPMPKGDVKNP